MQRRTFLRAVLGGAAALAAAPLVGISRAMGAARPYRDRPVYDLNALPLPILHKSEWIELDEAIIKAARPRLKRLEEIMG
jgi:hypothetical protein